MTQSSSVSGLERARERLISVDLVVPHTDADGLAAGAIALRARAEVAAKAVILERGQTPFGPRPPLPEGSVAVLDWGIRELFRPGLIVDHHVPEAQPSTDQVVVSGHAEEPETSTAALMRRICPEAPAWLAAVGAGGDLGDAAWALPECAGVSKGIVRRLIPFINAPRRVPAGPVRLALELLTEHDSPAGILADERIDVLREARVRWKSEYTRVLRTAPRVSGDVALIRFASRCQIHPLIATAWARRLRPRAVIAANDGYLIGRVNFAVRGGSGDLRSLLRNALPDATGEFAHGHPRASGGSLAPSDFDRLMRALGLER
jgi:single-stranded-DNA-specific exonuclease